MHPPSKRKTIPLAPGYGRSDPNVYRDDYPDLAYRFALLGPSIDKLAQAFGVESRTIERWIQTKKEFSRAVKRGRIEADAEIAHSLYHRAKGYSHPAVKIYDGGPNNEPRIVKYMEHYAPDTSAAIFWLKNRHPDLWSDRHNLEHSGTITLEMLLEQSLKAISPPLIEHDHDKSE